jgi:hypothetical protein
MSAIRISFFDSFLKEYEIDLTAEEMEKKFVAFSKNNRKTSSAKMEQMTRIYETLNESIKYNKAIQKIKNFRSKVKRYSAMCGLTPKKFQRVLSVLKKREFCEWWWHPDGFGGKNHLRNMEKMFNKWG